MTRTDFFNQRDSFVAEVFDIDSSFITVGAKAESKRIIVADDIRDQVEIDFSNGRLPAEKFPFSTVAMKDVFDGKAIQNVIIRSVNTNKRKNS